MTTEERVYQVRELNSDTWFDCDGPPSWVPGKVYRIRPAPAPAPLPCPWCGSAPKLDHLAGAVRCDPVMWRCHQCKSGSHEWHDTIESATAAWNDRRAPCLSCDDEGKREIRHQRDVWRKRADAAEARCAEAARMLHEWTTGIGTDNSPARVLDVLEARP